MYYYTTGMQQCRRLYGRCSGLSYDKMLQVAAQSASLN